MNEEIDKHIAEALQDIQRQLAKMQHEIKDLQDAFDWLTRYVNDKCGKGAPPKC